MILASSGIAIGPRLKKGFLLLISMSLLCCCAAALAYVFTPRLLLKSWFINLNSCFYRKGNWETNFFTDAVKSAGNAYSSVAALLAAGLAIACYRRSRRVVRPWRLSFSFHWQDALAVAAMLTAAIGLWMYADKVILPYMDEVFSAVHCGEAHTFQAWSYYMLPNNHILYNVTNNVLFHYAGDRVWTGRLLSGGFFLALMLFQYKWWHRLLCSRVLAVCAALVVMLHFQAWGFGAQARGYALYLLCEWVAGLALLHYCSKHDNISLRLHAAAAIIGYCTIPTFLYFHAALVLAAVLHQLYLRQVDFRFWKYQVVSAVFVFLFYVPALCFSGLPAFTANEYVTPKTATGMEYLPELWERLVIGWNFCYTALAETDQGYYYLLTLVPLLSLLWYRKPQRRWVGVFFLLMWIALFLFVFKMRRFPYYRNLIGQIHVSYALGLVTVYWLLSDLGKMLKSTRTFPVVTFSLVLLAAGFSYFVIGRERLARTLYFTVINEHSVIQMKALDEIPAGATVGLSDECFYLLHNGRKRGYRVTRCPDGTEAYYIRTDADPLPVAAAGHYEMIRTSVDYRIYELRK